MSKKFDYDFVAKFPMAVIFSTILIARSIFLLVSRGLITVSTLEAEPRFRLSLKIMLVLMM